MRRSYLGLAALVFAAACTDGPVAPVPTEKAPQMASFFTFDNPPPPWAIISGEASANNEAFSYVGWVFINRPGNVAWLMFRNGGTATFSAGARLMNVNGKVVATGTVTVGSNSYDLSGITSFSVDRSCTNGSTACVTFGGGGFSSGRAVWTGELANTRIRKPGDGGGDDVCTIETCVSIKGP